MADTTFVDQTTVVVAAWLNDVNKLRYGAADPARGAALLQYIALGGTTRDAQGKMRDIVSAFDFMTAAQIADVQARTRLIDVTAAVQAALDAQTHGGLVVFPAGDYLINTGLTVSTKLCMLGAALSDIPANNAAVNLIKAATSTSDHLTFASTAQGASMDGFVLEGIAGNTGDGIVILANGVSIRHTSVYRQGGNGCRIGQPNMGVNANSWMLDRLNLTANGANGLYLNDKYNSALTAAIANGSHALTASGSYFTASVVNSTIVVKGAGPAGADLTTTVATYVSPTQVTLTAAASTTVTVSNFWVLPDNNGGTAIGLVCLSNALNGVYIDNSQNNTFVGLLAETNTVAGIKHDVRQQNNTYFGGDIAEANGTDFLSVAGSGYAALFGVQLGTINDAAGTTQFYRSGKGTFTPVVTINGSAVGVTGSFTGEWERIGNRIQGTVRITLTSKGASVGTVQLTGMPVIADASWNNGLSFAVLQNFTGLTGAIMGRVGAGTSIVSFYQTGAAGEVALTDAQLTNTTGFTFTFNYKVND